MNLILSLALPLDATSSTNPMAMHLGRFGIISLKGCYVCDGAFLRTASTACLAGTHYPSKFLCTNCLVDPMPGPLVRSYQTLDEMLAASAYLSEHLHWSPPAETRAYLRGAYAVLEFQEHCKTCRREWIHTRTRTDQYSAYLRTGSRGVFEERPDVDVIPPRVPESATL